VKIIKATHLGMCFGVRDAIALALQETQKGPISILGELVHNPQVNQTLRENQVKIHSNLDTVSTPSVMISAHGASQSRISLVKERGYNVVEATCPLVKFAHRMLSELVKEGCHPIIIGKVDHVEVRGMTEDLANYDVVLNEDDLLGLKEHPKFGVIAQTTQPIQRVRALIDLLKNRFPRSEIRFRDTVCQPTKQRQQAAIDLAKQSDVMVVIGGVNSNNTKELVATCSQYCNSVIQIQSAQDLKPHWFYNAQTIGITAGTSTPDEVINGVEAWLNNLR